MNGSGMEISACFSMKRTKVLLWFPFGGNSYLEVWPFRKLPTKSQIRHILYHRDKISGAVLAKAELAKL